ncbi:putative leucine-rich repeat domain, L domain-containing protein [Medicago truncatula]|uniref:Putative leucine-rich repeat domain, L domain-containing protein n=1 Tax=Medicago truncatula TaxID=3880 RepID=A0A396J3U8_MEDTR|nr:putative leucine-rich repeat domain, L domain-containing protein [Medicago truncatula]
MITALSSLIQSWKNKPLNWVGSDPCGSDWDGIRCSNSRITELKLPSLKLEGQLSSAIQSLSELETLDISYNAGMTGIIPREIGNLKNLNSLALSGCGFSGPIPDSIGSLKNLTFLALNSNKLTGNIPRSLGNLANLDWLDLDKNQLAGPIPVSNDKGQPGLDMLLKAQHIDLGNNKLLGPIPTKLFNSSMHLKHVLFDHNQLTGGIPSTLSLVSTVEVVYLSHNELEGSLPDLTGLNSLTVVDLSDNYFNSSIIPSWVSSPSLPDLTTVILKDNKLSGTLNLSSGYRSSLQLIDLQNNGITDLVMGNQKLNFDLRLAQNRICLENGVSEESYCKVPQTIPPYSTPSNGCSPPSCSNDQIASPNCKCAFPYSGNLSSRAFSFSNYSNTSYYKEIEQTLIDAFQKQNIPVDSVSLSNPINVSSTDNFQLTLNVFPSQTDRFNTTGVSTAAFVLSNQLYKPPEFFSPYVFIGFTYGYY